MGRKLLLLFMTLVAVGAASAADSGPVSRDVAAEAAKNKAIAGRVFEEIFNEGKFQVAQEIYAQDFVNHGLRRNFDLQEDQAAVHAEKKAFPDLKMSVILMAAEGDWSQRCGSSGERIAAPDMMDCLQRESSLNYAVLRFGVSSMARFVRSGPSSINCELPSNS